MIPEPGKEIIFLDLAPGHGVFEMAL